MAVSSQPDASASPREKATPLVRQALGHHRRDTVAHRDAVQSVRDLHRSLLVRDHDQLRGLLKLLEDRQQARQVHVV